MLLTLKSTHSVHNKSQFIHFKELVRPMCQLSKSAHAKKHFPASDNFLSVKLKPVKGAVIK